MAESYSVKAILSATDNGFSSTLKNAMGAADSFGAKIKSGFNFGILTGMGQAAFGAITRGISGMVGEIDSSNAAWKTFESNMGILGKSGDEVKSVKKELQAFAETSVYSSSDMASTYAQLAAVGTKNTTELVKGFGGLAAAAENPQQAMKTLSQQATQMAAKPNVAWADFKLMLEQTPAGLAAVAKEMGMTTSEMVTAVQAGEVKTEDFFNAIQKVGTSDGFSKMATQYKTVGQAMDGLKETLGNKLTPAFDVLSQVGIKAVSSLSDALGKIDGQKIANAVQSTISTIKQFADVAKESFKGVGTDVGNALKALGEAFGITNAEFSKGDAIAKFRSTCESVAGAIRKVANFITENKETIAKLAPVLKVLAVAFVGMKVANTVAPGLTSFAGGLLLMAGKGIAGIAAKLFGIAGGTKAAGSAAGASAKQMLAAAGAFLMTSAAVLLIAGGFALMAQSAIALASAGWGAIAVMVAMLGALVGLGIGMVAILKTLSTFGTSALMAGAAMLMLGGAVLLIAVGFGLMAQASIALASAGWGAIAVMIGMVAAIALLAVGAALLGAALTAGAPGFIAFGAALLMAGVGAVLAATSLVILATCMPVLVAYGLQASLSILALGGALLVFGAGALVAGAGALVLGAGLLVVAAAVVVLAAGFVLLAAGALLTAGALAVLSLTIPLIAQHGLQASVAILALGGALIVFAAGAALAGTAAIILGAGMLVASVGILLCAAGIAIIAASLLIIGTNSLIAAASFAVMAAMLPMVTANALKNAASLGILAGGLTVFGAAALVAGAGALVLGAGIAVAAVAIAALAIAVLAMSVATLAASGSIAVLSAALPLLASVSAQGTAALLLVGAALVLFGAEALVAGAGAITASIGVAAFGAAMIIAAAGTLVMLAAIKGVSSSMKSIASNAKSAEKSLKTMQKSMDAVKSGLDALGDKAKSAMKKLTGAFDNTAGKALASGQKVGTAFTNGMQTGLAQAPAVARSSVVVVNATLLAGYAAAYNAGANISRGFAHGMMSQLGVIRSAAAQMAAAADKAVRAKAKIHSPSKVADGLGAYWGEGFVNGIDGMVKDAWRAAENLVSVPQIATPNLATAFGGELSSDYSYSSNSEYVIEVPFSVDGREFARATANYTQAELDRKYVRDSRKQGKV